MQWERKRVTPKLVYEVGFVPDFKKRSLLRFLIGQYLDESKIYSKDYFLKSLILIFIQPYESVINEKLLNSSLTCGIKIKAGHGNKIEGGEAKGQRVEK